MKYAGKPANIIPKLIPLFSGYLYTRLKAITQQAAIKKSVVNGWPGTRKTSPSRLRLLNTKTHAAVNAKNTTSTDTT